MPIYLGEIDANDAAHGLHAFVYLDPRQRVGSSSSALLRAVGDRESVDDAAASCGSTPTSWPMSASELM
jgi:hypothetical protein